jgi:hypothetical protein
MNDQSFLLGLLSANLLFSIIMLKQDIPWITPEIKRLIRKRDRIYKKLKSTRVEEKPNIIKKHRSAKHLLQQKLIQSYWNYIENIIIEDSKLAESKPSKKLWSFIKNQKM